MIAATTRLAASFLFISYKINNVYPLIAAKLQFFVDTVKNEAFFYYIKPLRFTTQELLSIRSLPSHYGQLIFFTLPILFFPLNILFQILAYCFASILHWIAQGNVIVLISICAFQGENGLCFICFGIDKFYVGSYST